MVSALCVALAVCCVAFSSQAHAAGFAILEQSAEGMGVAYAGSSAGYGDGSEVYFNPAAMSWIEGTQISHSSHLIIPSADFENQGSSNSLIGGVPIGGGNGPDGGEVAYVPSVFLTHQVDDMFTTGFGIHAPFGLATKYDESWVGRYHAVESELTTISLTPAVAIRPISDVDFSIGAAVNVIYADATLSNSIDFGTIALAQLGAPTATALGLSPQANDGFGEVKGDDWGVGFTLGAAYRYDDRGSRVGVSWHSRVQVDLTGDATFRVPTAALPLTGMGFFTDSSASAGVDLPESIQFGGVHFLDDKWSLLAEMQWTRWDRFDELRIKFGNGQPDSVQDESWENVWRYSLGVNYQAMEDLKLAAGFTFDEEPIPDAAHRTPRIPGNNRRWLALGVDYQATDDLAIRASYAHLFVSDGAVIDSDAVGNTLIGTFDNAVDLVSIGFDYSLG